MYLHLGNDIVVKESSIVGVFDIENTSISKHTKEYLAEAQKNGNVIYVTDDLPKSFIVCVENGKTTVYVCQVAPSTILKRNRISEKERMRLMRLLEQAEQGEGEEF